MRFRSLKLVLWLLNVVITVGVVAAVLLFVLKPPASTGSGLSMPRSILSALWD